jgi:hypothetical protein
MHIYIYIYAKKIKKINVTKLNLKLGILTQIILLLFYKRLYIVEEIFSIFKLYKNID